MSFDQPADKSGDLKYSRKDQFFSARILSNIRCVLGEGPAWDSCAQLLYWVDIHDSRVFVATADGVVKRSWNIPGQPSAVILMCPGKVLVPAGQEILLLCTESGNFHPFAQLSGEPIDNRCNDAKCDPMGNLWIGTMNTNECERTGQLRRFNRDGGDTVVLEGIGVANTLAWDTSRSRFYFADSMVGDIYVFDYDSACAEISNRKIFFPRDSAPGVPDGSAIDEEGYLWNARWDGGCVVRISPYGELDQVVEVPTRRPTSCAFGGVDMKTLYVTSAASDSSAPPGQDDQGGAVFSIEVNVAGCSIPLYEGQAGSIAAC